MTRYAPAALVREDPRDEFARDYWLVAPTLNSLGSATAGAWSWDSRRTTPPQPKTPPPPASPSPQGVSLRAPREVLQRMSAAAHALGRAESDVWVEAAREWLLRHEPHTPAHAQTLVIDLSAAGEVSSARRSRVWREIDGVLDRLRDHPTPRHGKPGAA